MLEQPPLSLRAALGGLARCVISTVGLLIGHHMRLPKGSVGLRLNFADGTTGRVYRETVIDRAAADPCVLVVEFRLRLVRGWGHTLFRWESMLNTPLFAGFPGLVSKFWLAHDQHGVYRGLYEWDGPDRAQYYARCLWWVLALVCPRDSIHYRVLPGLRRDQLLKQPGVQGEEPGSMAAWWRLVVRPDPAPDDPLARGRSALSDVPARPERWRCKDQ